MEFFIETNNDDMSKVWFDAHFNVNYDIQFDAKYDTKIDTQYDIKTGIKFKQFLFMW